MRKKQNRLFIITLVFAILAIVCYFAYLEVAQRIVEISGATGETIIYSQKIKELDAALESERKMLLQTGADINTITGSEYVLQLGELATEVDVKIEKLKLQDEAKEKDIFTSNILIEVSGRLWDVVEFQKRAQKDKAAILKNISIRQNNDFLWLFRDFDNTKILDWVEMPESELNEMIAQEAEAQKPKISVEDLLNQTDIKCYLEIEYLNR